jgi:putative chitinase
MSPIEILQRKIGVNPDGDFGPKSFEAFCDFYKLTQPQAAHFLGQCEHETGGFKVWEENLNYSKEALLRVFPKYFKTIEEATAFHRKPQLIANRVYGGRMGNTDPNHGWLYRGRGAVQLTGRSNYKLFSEFQKDPSILESPGQVSDKYAFDSAIYFFDSKKLFRLIEDVSDKSILVVSKAINVGNPFSSVTPHGMEDRIAKTKKYLTYFK